MLDPGLVLVANTANSWAGARTKMKGVKELRGAAENLLALRGACAQLPYFPLETLTHGSPH